MTIAESLKSKLESQGLFPDQADAVLEILKSENPIMGRRWDDDMERPSLCAKSPVALRSLLPESHFSRSRIVSGYGKTLRWRNEHGVLRRTASR